MRKMMKKERLVTRTIAAVLGLMVVFSQTIASYADEFDTATGLYEKGLGYLESADEEIALSVFDEEAGAEAANTVAELDSFDTASGEFETAKDAAIDNADIANTTGSEDEAYAAKASAEGNLGDAEEKLAESLDALNDAREAYNEADALQKAAEDAYAEAEEALADATTDTAEARKALEAAQAQIAVQEEKKNELESIQNQYYGTMVAYFTTINNGTSAVYKADGSLDLEASIANLTEAQINAYAEGSNDNYFKLARNLSEQLVRYMILNDENVDPATADFKYGEVGSTPKTAQEAVIFTNHQGRDQIAYTDKTNINNEPVKAGATSTQKWDNVSGNSGRENHVTVTYTDKDGVEHTEYYNYIRKCSNYGDALDLANGTLFMARIEKNENGVWESVRVTGNENNYDDYVKLQAAVDALNQIEDYNKAKEDVEAALKRVEALEARIEAISASKEASKARLESLRSQLDSAKETLEAAESNKESLEAAYEEAKAAVESIDLSRFNVPAAVVTYEEDTTSDGEVIIPEAETPLAPAVETPAAVQPAAVATAAPAVAAEVEAEAEAEDVITDEEVPMSDIPAEAAVEETEETSGEEVLNPIVETVTTFEETNIDTDLVPLSDLSLKESVKRVWWIWIVILAAAFIAYIVYKKNSKEEEI